jgi:hypothetical protein
VLRETVFLFGGRVLEMGVSHLDILLLKIILFDNTDNIPFYGIATLSQFRQFRFQDINLVVEFDILAKSLF